MLAKKLPSGLGRKRVVRRPARLHFPGALLCFEAVDRIVRQKLREARRRLVVRQALQDAVWTILAGLSLWVVIRLIGLGLPVLYLLPYSLLAPILGMSLVVALATAWWRWRETLAVAAELDARAGTQDRFVTTLQLPTDSPAPLARAAHREVAAFAESFSARTALPLSGPGRKTLWLLVPLVALAIVEGIRQERTSRLGPEQEEAHRLITAVRDAAEKRAENDSDLRKAAEELQKIQDQLPASAEPLREVLRTLAELEQKLATAAASRDGLTPAETAALAEALASRNPQLADDLRSGRNEAAAEGLEKLDPETLTRALEEAARHAEASRLREMAREGAASARTKLTASLRPSGDSGNGSERSRFLAEMSDLRTGSGESENSGPNDQPGLPGEAPDGSEKSAASDADDAPPEGSPGSEYDRGRGSDLTQDGEPRRDSEGPDDFVHGQQDAGSSLVEIFRASGSDDPTARQAYRSVYDAVLPAALDAVEQEAIPPGSRLMVRRYFEAIRPRE